MKIIRTVAALLLAVICLAAAFAAGFLLSPEGEAPAFAYILLTALMILAFVLIVGSAVLNARLMNRLRSQTVMQTQQQVLSSHAKAQEDISRVTRPFFRALALGGAYIAALCLLALALAFLAGYCRENVTILNLLSAYILYGIFIRLLRQREKPVMEGELKREDYPHIFAALNRATQKLNIAPPFKVVSDSQLNCIYWFKPIVFLVRRVIFTC